MAFLRLECLLVAVLTLTIFRDGCDAAAVGHDDVPLPPEVKIVGGGEVDIKNFPYQVYLDMSTANCGAVIISKRWVLTAAHCTAGRDPKKMTIRVGSNDRGSGGEVYHVERVINHPQYVRSFNYDISAMKISTDIKLDKSLGVDSVQLPGMNDKKLQEDTTLTITGWGRIAQVGQGSQMLRGAELSLIPFSKCATTCPPFDEKFMLCHIPKTGGGCNGDSGGPVTKDNVLYGLASNVLGPCGVERSMSTSVVAFRKWINDTTGV